MIVFHSVAAKFNAESRLMHKNNKKKYLRNILGVGHNISLAGEKKLTFFFQKQTTTWLQVSGP